MISKVRHQKHIDKMVESTKIVTEMKNSRIEKIKEKIRLEDEKKIKKMKE